MLGELYTWGCGKNGRLGHGDCSDQLFPTLVAALLDRHVIGVVCGTRNAHTLANTDRGEVRYVLFQLSHFVALQLACAGVK